MADTGTTALASNLALRVASAVVLAPLALAAAYFGGWSFAVFWAAAALAVLWEWTKLVTGPVWVAAGVAYAGVMFAAPVLLRSDVEFGLAAIVVLFTVVWATDILGYFGGRALGGPKLCPAVSPKKTWSGAIAGTLGSALLAVLVAWAMGRFQSGTFVAVALLLSVVAQLGDLMESALKRRFGAKDASQLIPGHGGVMDRLDGFWTAALLGCLVGLARGGLDAPARGLLIW